jgi:carboxypeptidase Q
MNRTTGLLAATCLSLAIAAPAFADATPSEIDRIVDEGLAHSEAMANASQLMDGIGPRLTNSESMDRAQAWAMDKFAAYGLTNIRKEEFRFGLGWDVDSWSARMIAPRPLEMRAIPVAWSPPTQGAVRAPVVLAPMLKEAHFDEWRGKLAGKIVLVSMPGDGSEPSRAAFQRLESKDIAEEDVYNLPADPNDRFEQRAKRRAFPLKLSQFLKAEGALAMVRISYRDAGLLHGEGYHFQPGETLAVPTLELAAEDYRRLARLEISGAAPQMEMAIAARFDEADLDAANVFAEIAGADARAGYVMAGAHFDSWIAGDGASDNGAGSVVVMEAARILKTMPKPKRTIRFALWSGEEQGLLGSIAYIERYLASRPVDPSLTGLGKMAAWTQAWPIEKKPGYDDLKAYFNLDNGSGKIRGIYGENNVAAKPLLSKWLAPFASMGATSVVMSRTGGTDHQYMQAIGLPGFQFVQDPLDYFSRVHHTSIDTVDHMKSDDIRQAATIMAAMLWQAANSDEVLPRPPLPTEPTKSDPFHVEEPED